MNKSFLTTFLGIFLSIFLIGYIYYGNTYSVEKNINSFEGVKIGEELSNKGELYYQRKSRYNKFLVKQVKVKEYPTYKVFSYVGKDSEVVFKIKAEFLFPDKKSCEESEDYLIDYFYSKFGAKKIPLFNSFHDSKGRLLKIKTCYSNVNPIALDDNDDRYFTVTLTSNDENLAKEKRRVQLTNLIEKIEESNL